MHSLITSYRSNLVGLISGGLDQPTITLIIGIVIAIITAAGIIIRLEFRVGHLEKHPIIEAVNEVNKEDAIEFYRNMRRSSDLRRSNKKNGSTDT